MTMEILEMIRLLCTDGASGDLHPVASLDKQCFAQVSVVDPKTAKETIARHVLFETCHQKGRDGYGYQRDGIMAKCMVDGK